MLGLVRGSVYAPRHKSERGIIMTRFKKEMMKRFAKSHWDSEDECGAYVIEEKALVVFYNPGLTTVLQFLRNGKQKELPEWEMPEITSPYLVYLCGGDIERARQIIKGTSGNF